MSYQRRVLLIDDEPSEHKVLEGLAASGYSVRSSYSGRDGIVAARDWRPDVTLVDYVMPEMDGPAVCTELKQHPTTKDLPVVMFSHERTRLNFQTGFQSADDYIEKSIDFEILIEKLRAWERHFLPYPLIEGHRQLVLTCTPNQPLSFRIDAGCATFNTARGPLEIEEDLYSSIANLLPHHSKVLNQDSLHPVEDNWRQLSKSEGWSIYSKIFKNFPELLAEYTAAKRSAEKDRNLHIQIESPRSLIPFPFEFFFDDKPADGGGEFLVVRHPLSRVVTTQGGGPARRRGISRNFLNNIRRAQNENQSDGKLRILLIASNTLPAIPGVDDEVDLLAKLIPELFANVGLDVDLRKVPTAEASLENVEKLLRDSDFHIIHFAGHGSFDTTTPERSYLLFWSRSRIILPSSAPSVSIFDPTITSDASASSGQSASATATRSAMGQAAFIYFRGGGRVRRPLTAAA